MEQKTAVIFEVTKETRTYQFIIPLGAPFGEVFDVAFEMLSKTEELSKTALENVKKSLDEAKDKAEEVIPEA